MCSNYKDRSFSQTIPKTQRTTEWKTLVHYNNLNSFSSSLKAYHGRTLDFSKKKKSTNKQTTNQPTKKKKHTQLFYQIRHTTWLSILFGITLIMNEIHYGSNTQCNSLPTNFIRKWIVRKKNCKPTLGFKRAKTVGKFCFILLWIVLLLVRWDFSNRKWILRPGRHRDGRT